MRVFILTPPLCQTGGAELLHQFSQCLSSRQIENYIYYPDMSSTDCPTPEAYLKYGAKYVTQYVDAHDSVLVVPEIFVHLTDICKKGKVLIWWLSIDNYLKKYAHIIHENNNDPFLFRMRKNLIHAVQSTYAKEYIKEHFGVSDSHFLSDYINDDIANIATILKKKLTRQNYCLYNPRKGFDNIKPLIQKSGKNITWIPLENLTPSEMGILMCKSKVYIDFGNHPGKDRIPREAAICGCCVITNRIGSAAYQRDVAIPDKYKVEYMTDIEHTLSLIHECMEHYEELTGDFDEYRHIISTEKQIFHTETDEILKVLSTATFPTNHTFDLSPNKDLIYTFSELTDSVSSLLQKAQDSVANGNSSDLIRQLLETSYTLRILQEGISSTLDNISGS